MNNHCNRRDALKTGTALAAALALNPSLAFAGKPEEAQAKMSIARYKSPGTEAEAIAEEARKLTRAAIDALGGMKRFVSKGQTVWVKPNIGWDRTAEQAANTNPDVVATLVKMCFEAGAGQVFVGDRTCNEAQRCYERSGIKAAAEKEGARVVILDDRKYKEAELKGVALPKWDIYTDFHEADVKINVPIAKHHGLSQMTLTMKNLMGVIGGNRGKLHQDIGTSLVDLYQFFKPELNVLDAVRVLMANGPTGGNLEDVKRFDLVAASVDPVALDAFGAGFLGMEPTKIPNVGLGERRGLGVMDYKSLNPKEMTV